MCFQKHVFGNKNQKTKHILNEAKRNVRLTLTTLTTHKQSIDNVCVHSWNVLKLYSEKFEWRKQKKWIFFIKKQWQTVFYARKLQGEQTRIEKNCIFHSILDLYSISTFCMRITHVCVCVCLWYIKNIELSICLYCVWSTCEEQNKKHKL